MKFLLIMVPRRNPESHECGIFQTFADSEEEAEKIAMRHLGDKEAYWPLAFGVAEIRAACHRADNIEPDLAPSDSERRGAIQRETETNDATNAWVTYRSTWGARDPSPEDAFRQGFGAGRR